MTKNDYVVVSVCPNGDTCETCSTIGLVGEQLTEAQAMETDCSGFIFSVGLVVE